MFEEDSMSIDFVGKKISGGATKFHRNITLANKYFWSEYYKDYSKNILAEYAYMPMRIPDYQYSEEIPDISWEIYEDTLSIISYLCQKATCSFRGRNYTAWFCPDIPINNGPWKFGGLPGLILKIYDEQNDYVFECIDIKQYQNGFPITKYDYNSYGKITRTKLLKLWGDIFDHYDQLAGVVRLSGNYTPEKLPYNPLERE
ncbi:hypothetical protein FACS189413_15350 [Bacteroidia bacterium]|nr:hypothetical protein FACS189413_15350 [Bacteroidia bacterium]